MTMNPSWVLDAGVGNAAKGKLADMKTVIQEALAVHVPARRDVRSY